MARTGLTVTTLEGAYGDYGAGEADITMVAGDAVNGNDFTLNEGDILIAHNTNVGAQTLTIDSVDDVYGREADITDYSLAADDYAAFGPFKRPGWAQSSTGKLHVDVASADILLGVLRQR